MVQPLRHEKSNLWLYVCFNDGSVGHTESAELRVGRELHTHADS